MLVAILNHFSAWVSAPKFVGIYYSRLALWAQYKIMRYFLYNYYTRFQKVERKKYQIYHQELEIPVTCIIHQILHNITKGALNSFCLFIFFSNLGCISRFISPLNFKQKAQKLDMLMFLIIMKHFSACVFGLKLCWNILIQ